MLEFLYLFLFKSDLFIKHFEISVSEGVWKKITFFIKCVEISVLGEDKKIFSSFKCAKVSFLRKKIEKY